MSVKINDIIGEKTIHLAYSIKNFDSSKEVAIVSMLSENIGYEFTEPWRMELELGNKQVTAYMRRELIGLIEGKIELTLCNDNSQINSMNKLADVKEIVLNLNELDNTYDLEDGKLSNALLTYYMTGFEELISLETVTPQYKKLKNG